MSEFDFEEGYLRLDAAFGEGSDSMPFIVQMHEFAMKYCGVAGHEFYSNAEVFVRGVLKTAHDFHFDVPSHIWDVYNVEAEALGANLVLFEDMAPAIDNVEPLIGNEQDLARLKTPDPSSDGRMPFAQEVLHGFQELTGQPASPCYCAPFTLAAQCMTFEQLILQIKDNPQFVHRVLRFLTDEVLAPYMNYMLRQFPETPVIDGSDAVASLPFITQEMLEEFSLQYIEGLQTQCERPVICDNWWGDSFAEDREHFWDLKLRATPFYFKIQDPDLFKVGVEPAMKYARKTNKPVVLGVDNLVLQNGPAEEIEKRIHEYMELGEPGGKTTIYLCSLSAQTPEEHVRAAVEAIHRFRAGDRPHAGLRLSGNSDVGARTADIDHLTRSRSRISAELKGAEGEAVEELLDDIYNAVLEYQDEQVSALVSRALEEKIDLHLILDDALIAAMDEVGEMFSEGTIFVPEMLLAARAMKKGLEVLKPVIVQAEIQPKGTVMLATVQGDVHDIGKNLVGMMLEGAGFRVVDLGVNQTLDAIIARAEELQPDVVGLSALLTTSMPSMAKTVAAFKKQKLPYKVMVGGAPVTREFADAIGADGYGENAPEAVEQAGRFVATS